MNRGDIYWVNIPERSPAGREIAKSRPCVVVSITVVNKVRNTLVMIPLTSNGKAAPPVAIFVPSAGKMSVAVCDQLFAVDSKRIGNRIGDLSARDPDTLDESIREILGL